MPTLGLLAKALLERLFPQDVQRKRFTPPGGMGAPTPGGGFQIMDENTAIFKENETVRGQRDLLLNSLVPRDQQFFNRLEGNAIPPDFMVPLPEELDLEESNKLDLDATLTRFLHKEFKDLSPEERRKALEEALLLSRFGISI
jgi:hypothetical protein